MGDDVLISKSLTEWCGVLFKPNQGNMKSCNQISGTSHSAAGPAQLCQTLLKIRVCVCAFLAGRH